MRWVSQHMYWLVLRIREQARSHIGTEVRKVDSRRLAGRHRRQASSHIWILCMGFRKKSQP